MSRALRSLRPQLLVLVVAALALARIVSLWLFADERSLAVRAALGFEAAGRAAIVALLLEEAPPDLRPSILRVANSPLVRFELSRVPAVTDPDHHHGPLIEARVGVLLGAGRDRDIRVDFDEFEGEILPLPHLSPEMAELHRAMMAAAATRAGRRQSGLQAVVARRS